MMLEDRLHNCKDIIFSNFLPEDWLKEVKMPTHVLVHVRSGIMHINDRSRELSLTKGQFVFLRRDHLVRLHKTAYEGEAYSATNIMLTPEALHAYAKRHRDYNRSRVTERVREAALSVPRDMRFVELFEQLRPYADKETTAPKELLETAVERAIELLLQLDERFYPTLFDFYEPWKIDLPKFMEENFTENMTIAEYARYTGRSLATFKRDFKKFSLVSPEKWLVSRRLEKALALLKEGTMTVTEVCWSVGFQNKSHFSTAFKRHFGYLPSQVNRI